MLCHSVSRVPPPSGSSSQRMSFPPQSYSSIFGASARLMRVSETCGVGAPTVESFAVPDGAEVAVGIERRPLAQMLGVGERLPDPGRRVAELADEHERPLVSVFSDLGAGGGARRVLLTAAHVFFLLAFRGRWRLRHPVQVSLQGVDVRRPEAPEGHEPGVELHQRLRLSADRGAAALPCATPRTRPRAAPAGAWRRPAATCEAHARSRRPSARTTSSRLRMARRLGSAMISNADGMVSICAIRYIRVKACNAGRKRWELRQAIHS